MSRDLGRVSPTVALGNGHTYFGPTVDPAVAHESTPASLSQEPLESTVLDNHLWMRVFVEVQVSSKEVPAHSWRKNTSLNALKKAVTKN